LIREEDRLVGAASRRAVDRFPSNRGPDTSLSAGAKPAEVKMDTGMGKLKPLLVEWIWSSWADLRERKELIKKGWERSGMKDVLEAARQVEALTYCIGRDAEAVPAGEEPAVPAPADMDTDDESEEEEEEEEEKEEDKEEEGIVI
jgi:hypothetical protein